MSSAPEDPHVSCSGCNACCCRLEVMLMSEDDVPVALTERDPWGARIMRRREDGWCAALDRSTMLCSIYARRPAVCREFAMGGDECLAERARCAGLASR